MHTVQEPDRTSNGLLIFIIAMIAATMGLTVLFGPMVDKWRTDQPSITNGERWARICAVEFDRGTEQERKDCVLKYSMGAAYERDKQEHQQRLREAR
jgi:hypothetical protein